jgi:phosphatidyl-myo-inositol alpha-mannosyltransferase
MVKKVLHLINGEFYSGAERVQDLLALRLPEFGWQVGFACLRPGHFASERKALHAPLHEIPMSSRFDFSPVVKVSRLLREGGYEILHTHTPRSALIGRLAAGKIGIPMVHHIHSPTRRDSENPVRNLLNTVVENWSLSRVKRLVAVSSSLRDYLLGSGFEDKRIAVVPNGVPVIQAESRWQLPKNEWVIGTVALFRPRKGLEILLQALASLIKEGVPVRLRAVGGFETTEYQQSVLALVESLGLSRSIDWTGFTSNVNLEFEKMHLFVLPSLYGEGLPMVVIEAMAAGLPVIGSRVEGIPEVLGNNEFGMVVEPGNPDSMRDGIFQMISLGGGAERMAIAGHARQRDAYSDEAMARGVAEVYRGVLN